jgi:hypothetical protein
MLWCLLPPTLSHLPAAVGTLVTKAMLGATNAPYAAPAPGSTLISLDVYTLQVRGLRLGRDVGAQERGWSQAEGEHNAQNRHVWYVWTAICI